MFRRLALAVTAALLTVPATARAHVTVQPGSAVGGGFTRLDVRVPNERDDAATTKVQLQLPDGFADASYEPVPGWTVKVEKGEQITWTSKQGIPPGAFQDFGLSVQVPGKAGDTLTFKALQTYSNGEVVRWIGPEGSDDPAPTVAVTGASGASAAPAHATPAPAKADGGGGDGLAIAALTVGALGLATGVAALMAARKAVPAR
jgi:uncharacterized protein